MRKFLKRFKWSKWVIISLIVSTLSGTGIVFAQPWTWGEPSVKTVEMHGVVKSLLTVGMGAVREGMKTVSSLWRRVASPTTNWLIYVIAGIALLTVTYITLFGGNT